jgi:serine/threonine protein kinase
MSTELMSRFLESLHASRLLDNNRIDELLRRPEPPQGDVDGVARFLEGNGWLTRFQIEEIREGRGTTLTFSGYRLLERLPDFPSGPAHRAFHPALQKSVVLRWLNREWLEPADHLATYLERAQAASLLAQPNILSVLDAGIVDDRPFIVQESVEGADLSMLVNEMGALPVMLACEYIRQTALALKAAAERGIFHGDLSPARLILTPVVRKPGSNGTGQMQIRPAPGAAVKVTELGLIPLRPPLQAAALGEYAFAAPERLTQPARDARADLWSLGACLYFMLSARPPFPASSAVESIQKLQNSEPLRVDQLRKDLPAPLAEFVHRLLSRDPGQRPDNAADVAQFLAPFSQYGAAPIARPIATAAVPLASETGTIPNAKPVPLLLDELPLAESLPHIEPLPAGTSDSRVYSPPSSISGPMSLPDEQHHELFADQHGFDSRPLPSRKAVDAKGRPIFKILSLVILLFILPWTVAVLYFTDTWPFDRPVSSSTSGDEKSGDKLNTPKKLKSGTRL